MPLILVDFLCPHCGNIFEKIVESNVKFTICPKCRDKVSGFIKFAKRIITPSATYLGNQDADWIKSVREVVDKEGGCHAQEFLKNPTRDNYKRWMKSEGLRPLDKGEGPTKPAPVDMQQLTDKTFDLHRNRTRIEVRGD